MVVYKSDTMQNENGGNGNQSAWQDFVDEQIKTGRDVLAKYFYQKSKKERFTRQLQYIRELELNLRSCIKKRI